MEVKKNYLILIALSALTLGVTDLGARRAAVRGGARRGGGRVLRRGAVPRRRIVGHVRRYPGYRRGGVWRRGWYRRPWYGRRYWVGLGYPLFATGIYASYIQARNWNAIISNLRAEIAYLQAQLLRPDLSVPERIRLQKRLDYLHMHEAYALQMV